MSNPLMSRIRNSPLEALHRAVSDGATDRIVAVGDGYPGQGLFGSSML